LNPALPAKGAARSGVLGSCIPFKEGVEIGRNGSGNKQGGGQKGRNGQNRKSVIRVSAQNESNCFLISVNQPCKSLRGLFFVRGRMTGSFLNPSSLIKRRSGRQVSASPVLFENASETRKKGGDHAQSGGPEGRIGKMANPCYGSAIKMQVIVF